jgi:hypothetical protein
VWRHRTGPSGRARENLFKPFKGSARSGGTGLGLAIARELVLAHGGSIALDESVAQGTAFLIELPDQPVPIDGYRARLILAGCTLHPVNDGQPARGGLRGLGALAARFVPHVRQLRGNRFFHQIRLQSPAVRFRRTPRRRKTPALARP